MRNILIAMMITFATEAAAEEQCDVLGSLQADSIAVADPFNFANIEPLALKQEKFQYRSQTSNFSQTLQAEFCIMKRPKSVPLIEQYPTSRS